MVFKQVLPYLAAFAAGAVPVGIYELFQEPKEPECTSVDINDDGLDDLVCEEMNFAMLQRPDGTYLWGEIFWQEGYPFVRTASCVYSYNNEAWSDEDPLKECSLQQH